MSNSEFDISASLTWEEGLPRPRWDLIEAWIESLGEPKLQRNAWGIATRQWLDYLSAALNSDYQIAEFDQFLILAPGADTAASLQLFASDCHHRLLSVLESVVKFAAPGKQVVIALGTAGDYYRYIAPFYAEGHHASSGGVHLRDGYPHIATCGP